MGVIKTLINPITRLSKEQWKTVVSRAMEREGRSPSGLMRVMADDLHEGALEPDVVKKVGALSTPTPQGDLRTFRLPIEEARAKYFSNPDAYIPGMGAPEMSQVNIAPRTIPPGVSQEMIPDGLAADIALSRVKQVPVVPSRLSKMKSSIEKDYIAQEAEEQLSQKGMSMEDMRPGAKPDQFLAEKGINVKKEDVLPPVGQLTQAALVADQLWKDMGGGRSMGAKVWEMYRASSRQKSHINTARDYFVSSFTRWKDDPSKFTKNYPREAKLLNQLWDQFESSLVPKVGSVPPTVPSARAAIPKPTDTMTTPRTDVPMSAGQITKESLPTFIQEGRFQGNVPFKKLKDGDIRAKVETYLKSFKTREELDQIVSQDPGLKAHIIKNWKYYQSLIERLPSGGK